MLVAFAVSNAAVAFSWMAKVCDVPPAVAVSVAVWAALTADAVAVKVAVVAFAATVTVDGTVTAVLLLLRVTVTPPLGAAALRVTVHESVAAPVSELLTQVSPLAGGIDALPVPLRSTTVFEPEEALLVTVICPVALPTLVGANSAVRL